jgi:hypothetical protein
LVEDRFKHLLGRDEEVCHLPDGHLEVHLWELEEPRSLLIRNKKRLTRALRPYRLKNCGMRRSLRRLSGTLPKVDDSPYRDIDMRGLVIGNIFGN